MSSSGYDPSSFRYSRRFFGPRVVFLLELKILLVNFCRSAILFMPLIFDAYISYAFAVLGSRRNGWGRVGAVFQLYVGSQSGSGTMDRISIRSSLFIVGGGAAGGESEIPESFRPSGKGRQILPLAWYSILVSLGFCIRRRTFDHNPVPGASEFLVNTRGTGCIVLECRSFDGHVQGDTLPFSVLCQ